MPDILTNADSLREYHSSNNYAVAQPDQALSLGRYRSTTEVVPLRFRSVMLPAKVRLRFASGANGEGDGWLAALGPDKLAWRAPGESGFGQEVTFAGQEEKVLEAASSPGKYVRVLGTPPFDTGAGAVTLYAPYDGVYGMGEEDLDGSDGSATATSTGSPGVVNRYRGVILYNVSQGTVISVRRWVGVLDTPRTSSVSQLGSAGAGSIGANGSLSNWPLRGWAQVRSNTGVLKEVVYYDRRTDAAIHVPSFGRSRLGTAAVAGTNTDVIHPVPGIALGFGGVAGHNQPLPLIPNQFTPPAGVAWKLGITSTTGVGFGTLLIRKIALLWVWREIPTQAHAFPAGRVKVNGDFSY